MSKRDENGVGEKRARDREFTHWMLIYVTFNHELIERGDDDKNDLWWVKMRDSWDDDDDEMLIDGFIAKLLLSFLACLLVGYFQLEVQMWYVYVYNVCV